MRPLLAVTLAAALLCAAPARADRNTFVVDLASDPASLDPHLQWDPDSYGVYRNVFDNLVTRDALAAIHADVPAVPLFQDVVMYVARKPVTFQPTASESFFLSTMGWRE